MSISITYHVDNSTHQLDESSILRVDECVLNEEHQRSKEESGGEANVDFSLDFGVPSVYLVRRLKWTD